jgi:FHA domain
MDPTDKLRQRVPAPPDAPRSPRINSVAPTPRSSTASPVTPAQTPPLPDDRFVGWDAGPDPITAICEYNVAGDWELRRDLVELSIGGSSQCTISIPGRGLSARHCLLERRARKLRLHDLDSSHGTFVRERRLEGSADLSPGDMFTAKPMIFVCLNDEMRQYRPIVSEILGSGAVRDPDWVMVQAATGSGPMLLTGEAGCDLDRLARALHAMSSRRLRKAVEVAIAPQDRVALVALAQQAFKTSMILPLGHEGAPLNPDFVSTLFDASLGVRLIALASSPDIARCALTDAKVGLMQHVPVRPLAYRNGEIHKLLDRQFAERAFHLRTDELTTVNQDALKTYHWPGNFDELREIVDAIIAHATLGGLRPAAKSLGISHHKLARRFEHVGLRIPLFRHCNTSA